MPRLAAVPEQEDLDRGDSHQLVVNLLIARIREVHRAREDMQRAEIRLTLQMKAIGRRIAAAEKAMASGDHITADTHAPGVPTAPSPLDRESIIHLEAAREVLHAERLKLEKTLEKRAKQLPVWPWVESVRGFGAVGLAQITAECGNLWLYPNPAKVWKRMGLAVMPDGRRQRKVTDPDEAAIQGYSPRRRAIMFVIGDSLIKGNGEGVYRTTYLQRKEQERFLHSDLSDMATHRRAQRYMEKLLLKHLWQAWRELTPQT